MDALSHAVVGAAVGELALGKKQGNRAIWVGALAALIPDIDLLAKPLLGDLAFLTIHRGMTHSLLFAILGSVALGWVAMRIFPPQPETQMKDWRRLFFWSLISHILLDCATAFGTQVFYPLTYRVSFGVISVVDPLFTVPIGIMVLLVLRFRRRSPIWSRNWAYISILWGMLYLTLCFTNKMVVSTFAANSFHYDGKSVYQVHAYPSLGNNFLWCVIAEEPYGFDIGYFSLLDARKGVRNYFNLPKDEIVPEEWHKEMPFQKLDWVSKGLYVTSERHDTLFWHDLRYGIVDPRPEAFGKTPFTLTYAVENWQTDDPQVKVQFTGIGPFFETTLPAYRMYW